MMNNEVPRKTKLIHGAGKLIVILASVPVFLFAIQSARGLVRVLSGLGSFVSLASIVVLGIIELTWIIVVSERKLPANLRHAASVVIRDLGIEAAALFLLVAVPVVILSAEAGISVATVLTGMDITMLATSFSVCAAGFLIARRLGRAEQRQTDR